ncbi:DNA internalization-related competence protein ComEC/Rec2 [uncultured Ellagibacter sp.]|uniref:DNA internalization-related competence protein ComEC/Rec2 n=1 Tax=uncultured Ellagibacter sp. TaxID=2137580 RepID=UPI00262E2316|nr:DNA internalization-related competence protein ComEC/Rec2 [uncultured Ellagibacter sp.]
MPPLTNLALALWGACAGSYTLGFHCAREFLVPLIAAACVVFALAVFALMRGAPPTLFVLAFGLAIGFALGFSATLAYETKSDQAIVSPVQEWCFTAAEDARQGDFNATVRAVARSQSSGEEHTVNVTLPKGESGIFYGDSFSATCALSQPREASAERFYLQGIDAVSSPGTIKRLDDSRSVGGILANVRKSAIALFDGQEDAGALCQALVCGYREQLRESDLYAACKTVGVAHLVAVSGAHLSIMCGMIASVLQVVRTPRRFSLAIQLAVLSIYLVLTGMPISALRAAAMAVVGMTSFLARRRRATLSALGACIVVIIAISPQSSVSISFFLSAMSTLGIIALMPLISSWLSAVSIVRRIAEPLALTLAAMVGTTPFSAALFSQLPLVSPVANLVVAPLFTLALTVSLVGSVASLAAPVVVPLALPFANGAAFLLAQAITIFAEIPFACVPVSLSVSWGLALSIAGPLLLWLLWPQLTGSTIFAMGSAACACAIAFVVVVPLLRPSEIVMLDVAQGDAFLLRSKGSAILIDTGNHDALLKEALARQGVFHLDAVVISHADDDHCGSLQALDGVVAIDSVLVAHDAVTCDCESCESLIKSASSVVGSANVKPLAVGDTVTCGEFSLKVIWPHKFNDEGGNADSLCLLASLATSGGTWTALFCGDAESEQLKEMIDEGTLGDIDIYKVGHHGSKAALTESVVNIIRPEVSLVSVGEGNRYGHPAAQTLSLLDNVGSHVFRTDEMGDVSCEFSNDSIRVTALG